MSANLNPPPECPRLGGTRSRPVAERMTVVEFWSGHRLTIEKDAEAIRSIPVKGVEAPRPGRFLEVLANMKRAQEVRVIANAQDHPEVSLQALRQQFFPRIPGVVFEFGEQVEQPPFSWKQATPEHLAVSFSYTTNAFYRILSGLVTLGRVDPLRLSGLLDRCCVALARLYLVEDGYVLRNINNNLNMFFVSKVVESVVGKRAYDANRQEPELTADSLRIALELGAGHRNAGTLDKMAIAMGRGVSFLESKIENGVLNRSGMHSAQENAFRLSSTGLAVDHRPRLLDLIETRGLAKDRFRLAVVLDDTAESVDDMLWIEDLLMSFPFLEIDLITNDAQVSVNFSSGMLATVLQQPSFARLASLLGGRLRQTRCYCPLISFQTRYLQPHVRHLIDLADAVFVKGANFFETCQLQHKEVFHAFVTFGAISRWLTGLRDFDGVFLHKPAGKVGYDLPAGVGLAPLNTSDPSYERQAKPN